MGVYYICCYCPYRCGERQKTWCCLHMFKHQLCRGTGEESNTLSKSTVTLSLGCDWATFLFQSLIFICSSPNVWTRALMLMSSPAVQSGWIHSCAKVKTCFVFTSPKTMRSPSHRRKEINGHIYLRRKTESKLWLCTKCINRFTCL